MVVKPYAWLWAFLLATAGAATTTPSSNPSTLPFGTQGLDIPTQPRQSAITDRSVELLGHAFETEKSPDRASHARELGECGKRAQPFLLQGLNDADPDIRAESIRSIGRIGDTQSTGRIAMLLKDENPTVRRAAVLGVAALGDANSVTPALDDSSDTVQSAALSVASSPDQADHIAKLLPQLPDQLKPIALHTLGRIGAIQHAKLIASMLKENLPIRAAATRALGELHASAFQSSIIEMLNDPSPTVRREAMRALPAVATIQTQQSLAISSLNDPDPTVARAAAHVLQNAPTPTAIGPLRAKLSTSYEPLHLAARQALVTAGTQVIPIAEQLLSDPNPRRREDASFLLGAYSSRASIDRHIHLLDDPDWAVVAQAAKSLYTLSPSAHAVGPHLLRLLQRGRKVERPAPPVLDAQASAFLLAGLLRYTPIIAPARLMVPCDPESPRNPEDQLRTAAIWAIGMTAQPNSPAASDLRDVCKNPMQSGPAVFESFKALFNMNDNSAAALLSNWDTDPLIGRDNNSRWMAHYICDRYNKTTTPFVPRPQIITLELSIQDSPGH